LSSRAKELQVNLVPEVELVKNLIAKDLGEKKREYSCSSVLVTQKTDVQMYVEMV
jgi:hypothetical protein